MNQRLVIASEIDKSNLCENVYQNNIVNPYEFLKSCENYSKIVHAKIPDGCYTNFRDALFHFWKLSRTYEWNELNCQAFAVCEHANRAKTDASLMLLRRSAMILGHILTDYNFDEYITAELISKHDSIRNMEMYIRLGGMMLENARNMRPDDETILHCFDDVLSFCQNNVAKEFREVIKKWPEDDPDVL